ncbi:MAG: FtsW/RodA/SpoVE family cell cycle protein, partial [Phycisphaerales bacterium]|nr:FtsW/RodA/SpoVE family cell cycle protein [Phycisphaerales bacterium]
LFIRQFALSIPLGAGAFAAAVIAQPYRVQRITSFLDPFQDPRGKSYHMLQAMTSVANGGGFGRGLGNGLSKFGYLPETETDFIFANICEELGIPGALLVAVLYGGILWAGLTIVNRQRPLIFKLVGLGVIATVGLQAVINMAVVTGLAPTKGIALPLLSSGGTGWILTAASLGLLINMDRCAERPAAEAIEGPAPAAEPISTDAAPSPDDAAAVAA